ncbi:aldehyde dehydrogenase family protein [Herbaspirillum sp. SJZ107]|uniref:aldehyde dehydrogenase family protein n=1 Tax=Herbaspirillum sp. SJZ107 TaxID=2572881 RepID=UPI00114E65E8|nr:aldehyde dehydrogenase family protein [Herbaspirillum sp. SJZ107]TQK01112.1 betaine-aldehyde dehydrogenase [Herbaspirillum sp. SJZ107]
MHLPAHLADCLPSHLDLYYDGRWAAPIDALYQETINPATGAPIVAVAQAGARDTEVAIEAAHRAFPAWKALAQAERAACLRKAAGILRANAQTLALVDAIDTGNPVAEMLSDAHVAASSLEYFAGLIPMIKGDTIPVAEDSLHYTVREPLGVVARIVAYNHPLMFAAAKIAAPLAAGNTVIVKAPDQAPLACLKLAELLDGVFPPGVFNVLTGSRECGQVLASHPLVKKVTLIGSVATGKAILRSAAETLKPALLELGGKNALVAYPDADMDALVAGAVRGMNFTWAGQSCGSTSRVFLHESIHDEVLARIAERVAMMHRPSDPTDPATTMGPLVSRAQCDRVLSFIASAGEEGARLVLGGVQPDEPALRGGYYVQPTIFADVQPHMRIAREEIFGPVMSVFRWSDEEELFRQVNGTEFGLTASVWTRDLKRAHQAVRRIDAGFVWVNQTGRHYLGVPFGGSKHSGMGREECLEELLDFTELKSINIQL